MEKTYYVVEIELLEDMLGTVPKNREVYTSYIKDKAREAIEKDARKGVSMADGTEPTPENISTALDMEEETIKDVEEKGWTGYHEDEEGPFLLNYLVKGFICEAARTLKELGGVKQLQDKFKRYCFVKPRKIRLPPIADKPLERPLRAMTAQGPRVTVVRSDIIPAGTIIKFNLEIVKGGGITKSILKNVLSYGELSGLGQWRTGSYGSFQVIHLEEV